jgi:hypothetical protein
MFSRLAYRARQFWNALLSPGKRVTSEVLLPYLSTTQLILFRRMQPSEQVHAFQVLQRLKESGQSDGDLLAAALLHDVGKILSPLSIFDRVTIVVGKRLFPKEARQLSEGPLTGGGRPFVVAARHAEWGADLVEQAGASRRTVDLVRKHQDPSRPDPQTRNERLLALLQAADDES